MSRDIRGGKRAQFAHEPPARRYFARVSKPEFVAQRKAIISRGEVVTKMGDGIEGRGLGLDEDGASFEEAVRLAGSECEGQAIAFECGRRAMSEQRGVAQSDGVWLNEFPESH